MKKLFMLAIVALLLVASIAMVSAGSGSIWTTRNDCGDSQQDVNEYLPGEHVFINGNNFDEGNYDWTITGQPEKCDPNVVVAEGDHTVDSSGAFCFDAYTVLQGDCGVYKVDFNNKKDNYHVIPEFSLIVGALTVVSAIGIFFFVRRK